jgi:cobalt-zinc-cadmium efflux system protein
MDGNHNTQSSEQNEGKLRLALMLSGSFFIIEFAGGILTNSLALLSDAMHMLTDVVALILAIVAIRIGRRATDARRTYGYRRFEILAAALNAALLFFVAMFILYEAYQRYLSPPKIQSGAMLIVATIGLLINILSIRLLIGGSKDSLNIKAAYLDALSDMIGSIGVIIAALIIHFTAWQHIDLIIAALIGLWILPRAWKLLSTTVNILLEGVPEGIEMEKIMSQLKAIPGITQVHDLHIWAITSGQNSLTAHLVVNTPQGNNIVLNQASEVAKQHGIEHTNFQMEIEGCGATEVGCKSHSHGKDNEK